MRWSSGSDPEELAARFEDVELTPAAMQRAFDLGLIAFDEDVIVLTEPTFLEVGATLAAMGVPVDEMLDSTSTCAPRPTSWPNGSARSSTGTSGSPSWPMGCPQPSCRP